MRMPHSNMAASIEVENLQKILIILTDFVGSAVSFMYWCECVFLQVLSQMQDMEHYQLLHV